MPQLLSATAAACSAEPLCIPSLLLAQAQRTPEAVALAAAGRTPLTYGALWKQIHAAVQVLNAHGVARGDRVAMVLPNSPEMAVAFLASSSIAASAPLNPASSSAELDFSLADLNARALIVPAGADAPAAVVARSRGIPVIPLSSLVAEPAAGAALIGRGTGCDVDPEFAQVDDVALLLHTSGTTSRPKLVPLTHRNLCASALHVAAALRLTADDRCLNVMPLFHIHGLVGALLSSLVAGASVICPPGFQLPDFFAWLDRFQPTWYTAVPTIHQAILDHAASHADRIARCPLRLIRSSSSPLPPSVMTELERVFRVPVIEAYGMTEAAHQIASNPLPPKQRKPGSVGLPAGPEVAVLDENGAVLPAEQIGEIAIRGVNVTRGYEANPQANEAAFTAVVPAAATPLPAVTPNRQELWFRTGDQGYRDRDGYLFLTGRLKELINRGGEKISPREVDEILLTHPAIRQAVTFAMPHSRLGEDVAAAVVLRGGATVTVSEIRAFAASRLSDFKVPRRVLFLDELPKGPTGKLQRIGLAEKLGLIASQAPSSAAEGLGGEDAIPLGSPGRAEDSPQEAHSPLHEILSALWGRVFGREPVAIHHDFFDLGGDSIMAAQLAAQVQEALGVELDLRSLFAEASTVTGMAALIEATGTGSASAALPPLEPGLHDDALPLSFAQERLWFVHQLDPESVAYNRPAALRLVGRLHRDALERSLSEIVRRHDVLRAAFPAVDGRPAQIIAPARPVTLPLVDLGDRADDDRETHARRLAREEARRLFDLNRGPLFRTTLLRLGEEEHVLLLTVSHIVFDGWSMEVVRRELAALYRAFSTGQPSPLPELPIQYPDFARWQREWLQGERLETQLRYWKQRLGSSPSALNVPTDRPRPAVPTDHGARQHLHFSRALTRGLKELSRREGATLFMTLLAAFQTLLGRYTGQEEITVGTPAAGRRHPLTEPLIGCFVNSLVLQADLSGDPSFRELLRRVRETALGAYAHQDLPFERVAREPQPQADQSRLPLFQVMFQLRNVPRSAPAPAGLEIEEFPFDPGFAKFDLSLEAVEKDERLSWTLVYNTDLFDEATITRMLGHLQRLLEGIVADPDQRLSRLPILTEAECRQIWVEWNDTASDYPRQLCIHHLFERQVERTPDAPAVLCGELSLTYAELNRQANQLAHYLMSRGVGPERRVALCVERSPEMLVALLGILKAGGAYVPLDPDYPRARLAQMLADARPSVLVTQEHLATCLPETTAHRVVLERDRNAIDRMSAENLSSGVTAENLAYVIYTSGSTGQPKGVMVGHRGVCNFLFWRQSYFPLTDTDRLLQKGSISFDDSVWECFEPLMVGALLVLALPGTQQDSASLVQQIRRHQITAISFVPSMLQAFLEEPEVESCRSLKRVTAGGEALCVDLQERFFTRLPAASLYNGYGPTEATIAATFWTCQRGENERAVPIGRPIANTQIFLLDRHLQPVPVGVPGELCIGGEGLARGYLNQPALTKARFIPHPLSRDPGARLYRTGDLARYRPDGVLEFLGRLDTQVKLRGFRIELGEIEAVLRQHPALRDAVALAREGYAGEKQLVAYVVPKPGVDASSLTAELRPFLRKQLPDYMLPSAFVLLEALPLSPNGKLDRGALPPPEFARAGLEARYVAPRGPTEKTLVEIWTAVLGVDPIGVHDSFFELGGHSLLATQVVARIRNTFQVQLPLRAIFETPTVAGLAATLVEERVLQIGEAELTRVVAELEASSDEEIRSRLAANAAEPGPTAP